MGVRAENVITISSVEGAPGEEVTVSVGLENSDAVSSLQVSIPLDENLTLVEGSGLLGSRCGSHSLTVGVRDGVLNVFVYSLSMAVLMDNSGEVASFKLKLGNQPVTVSLIPSKAVLTSSAGESLDVSATTGTVTTRCAKALYSTMEVDFGRVPIRDTYQQTVTMTNAGNADLTVTGLTFSDVNVFSSTTAVPFNIAAGASKSLNITYAPVERGNISRTLKVACNSVSKLNTIALKAQPYAVNELHVLDASGISDEEVTVRMTMNNMDAVSGFQVEFTMPEMLEYVDGSFSLSDRKQDHQAIVSLNGGVLRIIVYSGNDRPFTGNDGEIGSFRVKLVGSNGVTLTPSKTVLSATINNIVENVVSAVTGGYIAINSPRINTSSSLSFGAVSVTEPCEKTLTIRNNGNAPLTISRVVFNNENLSVRESLPIEIASSKSTTLTVVYSSVEQATFNAIMDIYSNDPNQRMKAVTVTGSRFAPNYISINANDAYACGRLIIDVSVDNYDDMTGLQFDVEYPGEYFEPFDNNYTLTSRAAGMTVITRQTASNTLRVFCYFLTGGSVAAGNGKIMTLELKPKTENIPSGNYNVKVTNIIFGTSNMDNKYTGSETLQDSFEQLTDFQPGDANGDGIVDTQDAIKVVQYYLQKNPDNFILKAADVTKSGDIDTNDAIQIIKMFLKK